MGFHLQLVAFTIEGYQRFVEPTSVKLHGGLIALVGPNEAGKSSVLQALTRLNDDLPFERSELPRRSNRTPTLTWQVQLEKQDRADIAHVQGGNSVSRVVVTKASDGSRKWTLEPTEPVRSLGHRISLLTEFDKNTQRIIEDLSEPFLYGLPFDRLVQLLKLNREFSEEEFAEFRTHADAFRRVTDTAMERVDANPISSEHIATIVDMLDRLSIEMESAVQSEQAMSPALQIRELLQHRIPVLRLYNEDDRNLRAEYDLALDADNLPPALKHLASIAGLDCLRLRDDALRPDGQADVTSQVRSANRRLQEAFAVWKQEDLALQLALNGTILHVQVTTPDDDGVSSLNERSEGMRWFASLLTFMHGHGDNQILLADEIETHLHYDAQSDLIDVLAKQRLASKIIYTTHSFGCLPNDLGNGVRVVKQIAGGKSALQNGFWAGGAGFSPLLLSMGAAATSFTPTRRAVIGEGATEAIILPTLFRQVAGQWPSFQVAPGLSSVAASNVPSLQAEAGHVAYIVDGDSGGAHIRTTLNRAGIPDYFIVDLMDPKNQDAMETEDLIDPVVYIEAINDELRCWNTLQNEMTIDELSATMRTKSVDAWCLGQKLDSPDKAAVAQRVANHAWEGDVDPESGFEGRRVFSLRREELIKSTLLTLNEAVHAAR